jgi:aryl-alcohol dehydrogenase-like predicted oxidoreductase
MKRRDFIRTTSMVAPVISMFPPDLSSLIRQKQPGKLEKRSLGRTGEMLSMIGFGGIVVKDATPAESSALVKLAIDSGVNYFDVAPSYGDAEVKLGPALEPYRKNVFLACKTGKRTGAEARAELDQSLQHLRTDHFDLYQHHAVTSFLEARKEGKVRFIGFSAHSVEAAMAMMDRFDFDTILFPFNYTVWYAGQFGPQVMAKAKEKNMGILALKAMAKGPWPEGADRSQYSKCWYQPLTSRDDIRMGLRFTLSHPVTACIPPGEAVLFKTALDLRDELKPLTDSEIAAIKAKAETGVPLFKYEATT